MKLKSSILALILLTFLSCTDSGQLKKDSVQKVPPCDYLKGYVGLGNSIIDTIRVGQRLIDPVDDFTDFVETDFGFMQRENKIYKKAKTHRQCDGKLIDIEYYQDFSDRIDLATYNEYDETYFTSKDQVFFWWVNSGGHLMFPINNANPQTFQPFKDICGGLDDKAVYYGCPNHGVYTLDISIKSDFKFIPKEDNYWNAPSHYVVVDKKVYDVKYELEKGYFCERDNTISLDDLE